MAQAVESCPTLCVCQFQTFRECCGKGDCMSVASGWSKTWTFFEDKWHEGNVPIMGPRTHAAWLCSVVFDGARYFEGVAPDLELHCARVNESAAKLFLKPIISTESWVKLAREGFTRFDKDAALYVRPMYWAEM